MVEGFARSRKRLLATLLCAFTVVVGLGAWALASPVGASPDEDYHLASIWCGQGLREGYCEAATGDNARLVPVALTEARCFSFEPETSAACQGPAFADGDNRMVATTRGNFGKYAGDYPPVFYWAMSHFTVDDVSTSVVLMRLFSCVLFVSLVGGVALLTPAGLRRGLLTAFLITSVPLGVFLFSSINPSGWALLSIPVLFVTTLGYLTTDERPRRLALGGLAAVSLLIGAGARADAAMYAIVAIGAAAVYVARIDWAYARRLIYPSVLAVIAGWAYLAAGQSSAATQTPPSGTGGLWRILDLASTVPSLWTGALGGWGLGWLDTQMPAFVAIAAWSVFGGVTFLALASRGRRRAVAVAVVGLSVWFVPSYILWISGYSVGEYVQPRYIIPLLSLFAVAILVRPSGPAFTLSSGQRWTVVVALAVANASALFINIRRYVTGTDVKSPNLDQRVEWWWGLPVPPMGVWIVGSLAFLFAIVMVTRELTPPSAVEQRAGAAEQLEIPSHTASDDPPPHRTTEHPTNAATSWHSRNRSADGPS